MSQLFSSFMRMLPVLLLPLGASASFFCDESTISFGMAHHQFRDLKVGQNNTFYAENYHSSSPTAILTLDKQLSENWSYRFETSFAYDLNLGSENELSNGRRTYDAHSWNLDMKYLTLFQSDAVHGVFVGLGAGVGNFALRTATSPMASYVNYGHLLAPIFHVEHHYTLGILRGAWNAEFSRVDFFGYFQGNGYSLENQFWIYADEEVEQGLKIGYAYWNLHKGQVPGNREWISDFHGISWTMELKFR